MVRSGQVIHLWNVALDRCLLRGPRTNDRVLDRLEMETQAVACAPIWCSVELVNGSTAVSEQYHDATLHDIGQLRFQFDTRARGGKHYLAAGKIWGFFDAATWP